MLFIQILKRFLRMVIPPPQWQIPVIVLLGVMAGVVGYLLVISNAISYLSEDPKTCINCHVMFPQYATWERSSHARVATCMDCHVPHDNIVNKYFFKAKDGTRHATIFTMRTEPQVIRIHAEGKAAVQANCLRCHEEVLSETSWHGEKVGADHTLEGRFCWDCHREVPHGRVHSLSSTPYAGIEKYPSVVPQWLKEIGVPHVAE